MAVGKKPTFFKAPAEFGQWLEENHERVDELWVRYHKKDSGKPSITWPESVDQALCFGWIDGLRKRWDESSYMVRFTPRRARSIWSKVNIARVVELTKQGLMRPAGRRAFSNRDAKKSGVYSFENRLTLSSEYEREFKDNATEVLFGATAGVPTNRCSLGDERKEGRDATAKVGRAHIGLRAGTSDLRDGAAGHVEEEMMP